MSRIPDEEIPRLKREVPLTELCRRYAIDLEPRGRDLIGSCPFHEDKTPSFVVTPAKNLWHCLGACGEGGSNIDLIMKIEKTDFRNAIQILRTHNGANGVQTFKTRLGTERTILVDPSAQLTDQQLFETVLNYYQKTFMNQPAAMQYLQARGCFHPEAVKHFSIGYANRTLGYRIPETTQQGKELKARLQRLGILRESGHEHLNGCVLFPIFNEQNHLVEIYGRRITKVNPDASPHLYLSGPHAGVWNLQGVKGAREWLLCEAIIDALSFWCHGFQNVTASFGVHGFSPDHWKLLKQSKPDRVLIAYDNDDAGNKAANELAQQLEPLGIQAWRVELKAKSDINDLVRGSKDPKAALASLLAGAIRLLPEASTEYRVQGTELKNPVNPVNPVEKSFESSLEIRNPESGIAHAFSVSSDGKQAELKAGERNYRVRGLENNTSFDHLKINLRILYRSKFHLDTFDLFNARQRAAFIAQAEQVTGVTKNILESDLSQLISHLEKHQEQKILSAMKPVAVGPVLQPEDEAKALALLQEPKLFDRILADFEAAGTVGEGNNKLIGYLIAVSRKLDDPLAALIVSRSAAGKSSLLNAILDFVPDEDKKLVTSMTTQALYYLPDDGLKNKVLAVVEDEGSENASYPLKILQSEKKLILAVTVKDPDGGIPKTQLKEVDGPCAQFMTSTRAEFDEELANRYLVLSVDEDREQTRRIHAAQREAETLRGLLRKLDRDEILRTHHNAQRLLRPLRVVNPKALQLNFPDDQLRLRRDHKKYLGLIKTIAFLRQYQKPIHSCDHRGHTIQYIEVDATDLDLAHELASQVLGRSLDELAPPTRSFLLALHKMILLLEKNRSIPREKIRFSRREVREHLKWSEPQVRRHLDKLLELEYVLCHRIAGTGCRYLYELLYDGEGQNGEPFLIGLSGLLDTTDDPSSSKIVQSSSVRHGIVPASSCAA